MQWLVNRLKEASTWKGILLILSITGYGQSDAISEMLVVVGPQIVEQSVGLCVMVLGAWEVIRKERTPEAVNVISPVGTNAKGQRDPIIDHP